VNPWKRKQVIGNATLYLGNAQEWMLNMEEVDAIVSDPPYGIGKAEWDQNYPEWFVFEALRHARMLCVMPGLWALPKCVEQFGGSYKSVICGYNTNGMTFGPIGFNNWIPAVVGGDVPHKGQDAFRFSVGLQGAKVNHPSPKPIEYMTPLVERVTERGWTVCDPFMGSGTTGVACMNLGRKFIGIEIEPKYFDIACERIENAQRQERLFA
jgi:DNA modification methylase